MTELSGYQLVTGIFVGLASGYLGAFMVIRRMALVGDALSHVALPGVALALLYNLNPFIGAFATLFAGIVGIWLIEYKTRLSTESLVGLFFTFSLAVGVLLAPDHELVEALFGDIAAITRTDAILAVALSVIILFAMRAISKGFILGTLSPELAQAQRVRLGRVNFLYLLLVAGIVALGIKAVGTLLMGALVVIPAISSRNFSSSLHGYATASGIIGMASLVGGILLSGYFGVPPGPMVVFMNAGIFLATLAFKK